MKTMIQADGQPFIMLAGEVHNSNASSLEAMEPIWEKAVQLGLNSVLLPVYWEVMEPQEGVYDFSLVDGLLRQAREHRMHVGLLWFGAWKNAQCWYAPAWVKSDPKRFWRAEVKKGQNKTSLEQFYGMMYTTLSCHCEETLRADSRAFAALMGHLREVDGQEHTVVLMQVENEPGLQGAAREHSDYADKLFAGEVPAAFAAYMRNHTASMSADVREAVERGREIESREEDSGNATGTWQEVFGDVAEEIFHAYSVASYVERVAAAGLREYELPLMVNAWLDKGQEPGMFPSGGPVARMMEVWKYCAPSIDIYAPDIYVPNFFEVCDDYTKLENPLLIPETSTHGHVAPRLVYCIGHYHALGFAPFAFEDMGQEFSAIDSYLFGVDTEDSLIQTPQNVEEYAWYNRTLNAMMPLLAEVYGTGNLQAVICEVPGDNRMLFDRFGFQIMMNQEMLQLKRKDAVCLALCSKPDEFYLIACGCIVAMFSADPAKPNVDILTLEEGEFADGQWKAFRRLNGDEAASMRYERPTLLRVKLLAYE